MEWLDTFWSTYSTLVLTVGTNILLALSIYLTLACGLLTVANAAFMGIGAYTSALLTIHARFAVLTGLELWRIASRVGCLGDRSPDPQAIRCLFGHGHARLR